MAAPEKKKSEEAGAPGWIVTFADLMSLLLTFFVLILSFAEIEASKFKRVMGSIKMAFGVQKHKIYEFMETSSNPFETASNGKDSDKVIETDKTKNILTANANDLCGLEAKSREAERERTQGIRYEMEKRLLAIPLVAQAFNISMDDRNDILRLGVNDSFFEKGSSKVKKNNFKALKQLFKSLEDKKLNVYITNKSDPTISQTDFKKWKLSADRSLFLAYVSKNLTPSKDHDISVRSGTSNQEVNLQNIQIEIRAKGEYSP